ncbi:MAG TPA: hypothetical protein VMJ32_00930 [Pirellulales bacterium]|nr:hypothetical protein [Pirellulales bacterium]
MVDTAYIKMQSLNRLLGSDQGLIETGFNQTYLENELDATKNPSEIFLDVYSPPIDLNLTGQGQSAGGVAQPNARLAAVSRKKGMVGGRPKAQSNKTAGNGSVAAMKSRNRALAATNGAPSANDRRLCDFGAAESGRFDPAEFLGGGLGDAKLLGIVPLKDVVRVVAMELAPQLQEVEDYSNEVLGDAAKKIQDAAAQLSKALETVQTTANENIKKLWSDSQDPLAEFYPELSRRMTALEDVSNKVAATPQLDVNLIGELISRGRELLGAIEDTVKNPMPAELQDYIKKIRDTVELIKKYSTADGLKDFVIQNVLTPFNALQSQFTSTHELTLVFQAIFGPVSPVDVLRNPQQALDGFQRTPYFEAFAAPLLQALAPIAQLVNTVKGLITWSRIEVTRQLATAFAGGNASVVDRLLRGSGLQRGVAPGSSSLVDLVDKLDPLSKVDVSQLLSGGATAKSIAEKLYSQVQQTIEDWLKQSLKDVLAAVIHEIYAEAKALDAKFRKQLDESRDTKVDLEKRQRANRKSLRLNGRLALRRVELEAIVILLGHKKSATLDPEEIKNIDSYVNDMKAALPKLSNPNSDESKLIWKQVPEAIVAQLAPAVQRLSDALQTLAQQTLEDVIAKLLSSIQGWAETIQPLATFLALANTVKLDGANGVLANIVQSNLFKLPANLNDTLAARVAQLLSAEISSQVPDAVRTESLTRLARVRASARRVDLATKALLVAISSFTTDVNNLANSATPENATKVLNDLQATLTARRQLLDGLQELALAAAYALKYFNSILQMHAADSGTSDVVTSLKQIATETQAAAMTLVKNNVTDALKVFQNDLVTFFPNLVTDLTQAFDGADLVTGLEKLIEDCNPDKISNAFHAAVIALDEQERKIIGATTAGLVAIELQGMQQLELVVRPLLSPLFDLVKVACDLYDAVDGGLIKLQNALKGNGSDVAELLTTVASPGLKSLDDAQKFVDDDAQALHKIYALQGPPYQFDALVTSVSSLVSKWTAGEPGLVKAARILSRLMQQLLHGQLGALVDFSALRAVLEAELLQLVPTKFSQSYDWDTTLGDFPESDPIFLMDHSDEAMDIRKTKTNDLVNPFGITPEHAKYNDLLLIARVEVDLKAGTREAKAAGLVAPFKIHLLGDAFDLITVGFKGAEFQTSTNGGSTFNVQIGDIAIGKELEFIDALRSYFNPGGNGLYVTLSPFPPAVEVGYRYSQDVISLGAMSFLNIGMSVSMLLPFDGSQALFRFSFASRDKPFLISFFPYGGGGFVGLIANAKGIVGFEISFEFGAVVAIAIGPLSAHGSVTAGIYLCSYDDAWILEGFVRAMGQGHIACFGVAVNMEIRIRQENGGAMAGSATFEFSFSIGFLSAKFSITASKRIEGKGSAPMQHVAFYRGGNLPHEEKPQTIVNTPRKQTDWRGYRRHLALV